MARVRKLALAQATKESRQILGGTKNFSDFPLQLAGLPAIAAVDQKRISRIEPTIDDSSAFQGLLEGALDHLRRAKNVDATLCETHEFLSREAAAAPSSIVESDWLYKWREAAADVTKQEVRTLLARLLAGEIKQPGAFSFDTLNFLRKARSKDIATIKQLCPFVFNRRYFWISTSDIKPIAPEGRIFFVAPLPAAMSAQIFVDLIALGLMCPASDPALSMYWCNHPSPSLEIEYFGRKIRISGSATTKIAPPVQSLTVLGEELVEIVSKELSLSPVDGYIERMIDEIRRRDKYVVEEPRTDTLSTIPPRD
jgi:hypothetical protein